MIRPTHERALIVAFRVLTLLVATFALAIACGLVLRRERVSVGASSRYVCPMHPEVTSLARGVCPICRMDLEAVGGGEGVHAAAIDASTFQLYDDARRRGFGVHARAPAWVDGDGLVSALLYEDEIASLARDRSSSFFLAQAPSSPVEVVPLTEPAVPWDGSTSRLRFRVSGKPAPL
ncbi:MAG: hypothetical protein M3O36_18745, partial [Myxococcota bacterium]|nr:hypothetical protein [Myxococcota bacterium]